MNPTDRSYKWHWAAGGSTPSTVHCGAQWGFTVCYISTNPLITASSRFPYLSPCLSHTNCRPLSGRPTPDWISQCKWRRLPLLVSIRSRVSTDDHLTSLSYCQALFWVSWPYLYYCFELFYVGCPLWPEDGSSIYNSRWSSPAQTFQVHNKSRYQYKLRP
jgi:hypothetical protein